jgi:hypothetical protein
MPPGGPTWQSRPPGGKDDPLPHPAPPPQTIPAVIRSTSSLIMKHLSFRAEGLVLRKNAQLMCQKGHPLTVRQKERRD